MSEILTNADRAINGEKLIRAIADRDDADAETLVIDALADIMHLCERDQVDFNRCLAMAFQHYCEESDGWWPDTSPPNSKNRH